MKFYGKELILDLSSCDISTFNRKHLSRYFIEITKLVDMQLAEGPYFWEDHEIQEPHLQGISAFHFIETSNIVVHTLTLLKKVFINLFTCKDFEPYLATEFTKDFFKGKVDKIHIIIRG